MGSKHAFQEPGQWRAAGGAGHGDFQEVVLGETLCGAFVAVAALFS
jgi:hypothetical protein